MKSKKNLHLEHLEDEIINEGSAGAVRAFKYIEGLLDIFEGNSSKKVDLTVKWDGAPAIVAGVDPVSGLFFVGTKHAAFGKVPRLAFTEEMIDMIYEGKSGLIEKLKIVFRELQPLGLVSVVQGDLLFTPDMKSVTTIDGKSYITFKPNTIVYAIPANDPVGVEVAAANIGIVFHTLYTGTGAVNEMSASFGVDVSHLKTPTAWIQNASYKDVTGKMKLTAQDSAKVNRILGAAKTNLQSCSRMLDQIAKDTSPLSLFTLFKLFVNDQVKKGSDITYTKSMPLFEQFVISRIEEKESAVKTPKAKDRYANLGRQVKDFMQKNSSSLRSIFLLYNNLLSIKGILIKKLDEAQSTSSFLETENGFEATTPEGYVAVDTVGNAVKLVNRLEFSRANFGDGRQKFADQHIKFRKDHQLKTMIFTFARMNPPTAGHRRVANRIHKLAREQKADSEIVLSHSHDNKTNPLDPQTKLKFARKFLPRINIRISSPQMPNYFKFLEEYSKAGYEKVVFVVGSDRVNKVKFYTSKYQGKLYNFKILDIVSAGERDPDSDPTSSISASKMREYAVNDDYVNFKKGLPANASINDTKELMAAVKSGLEK